MVVVEERPWNVVNLPTNSDFIKRRTTPFFGIFLWREQSWEECCRLNAVNQFSRPDLGRGDHIVLALDC